MCFDHNAINRENLNHFFYSFIYDGDLTYFGLVGSKFDFNLPEVHFQTFLGEVI